MSTNDNRIRFSVFGGSHDSENYYFSHFLGTENKIYSRYKPSIIFFEPFFPIKKQQRVINKNKSAFSVFFTGECNHSPMLSKIESSYSDNSVNSVNLSLGFDYEDNEKYLRYPLWILYFFQPTKNKDEIYKKVQEFNTRKFSNPTQFCSHIASHDFTGIRTTLCNYVESVAPIAYAGKFRHNDDSLLSLYADDKYRYLEQFKFNLCPENYAHPGYITEKIFQSLWSDCIPIYHGGDRFPEPEVINEKSFVFLDPQNPNDGIQKIHEIHTNNTLYNEIMKENKLKDSTVDFIYNKMEIIYERIENFTSR